jgi:hypothetical protein
MSSKLRAMDAPAVYLIRVQGDLDKRWLDYFGDISIVVSSSPGAPTVSTICARPVDQAALLGILNGLYDFGYPLLYVERLGAEAG